MTKIDKRGARGQGYGELGPTDFEFMKPDFDVKRQRGERYVGIKNTVMQPQHDLPVLEGDDA